tara:strand:- start:1585 stop:1758 length:174 start_codon:yes stop_codon:yes gene_type:complete
MELMKNYIDSVGRGIPHAIKLAQSKEQSGHEVWKRFYGYYSLRVSWWTKIKIALKNG